MRQRTNTQLMTIAILVAALGGCAQRSDLPTSSAGADDDAICRANGVAVGSAEYAACRKNRDVQGGNASARADRAQRNLAERMLNNPERP